ncbi:MAG: hypothetical protein CL607_22045 [Anaerolineaceae bacterium]|nr:hypothetical protein [Anaerolineaceae bacterium]
MLMSLGGLEVKVEKNVALAFLVMAVIFAIVTLIVGAISGDISQFTAWDVIWVTMAAAAFHFVLQAVHLIGHAIAAWTTGYQMSRMWFLYAFAMTLYPRDEPPIPARLHIRRSLGGPIAFGIALIIVFWLWSNVQDATWKVCYLTSFMLFEAILLFFVSSIFTDGVMFIVRKQWLPSEVPSA